MATERLSPDALLDQTGLTGSITNITDDPDSPDANWLTTTNNTNTVARASFPTPTGNPTIGAGLQEFRVLVRKTNHSTNPTCVVDLYENGSLISNIVSSTTISTTTGIVLSGTWDATSLGTADGSLVEVRVAGTVGGGSPTNRASVEVGAVEWNVTYDVPVTAYTQVGQAQANLKRTYEIHGQVQTYIKQTRNIHGQAIALITRNGSTYVIDTFSRSVSDDLGTADIGGDWTHVLGTPEDHDVNGSEATFTYSASTHLDELQSPLIGGLGVSIRYRFKLNAFPDVTIGMLMHLGTVGSNSMFFQGFQTTLGYNPIFERFSANVGAGTNNSGILYNSPVVDTWYIVEATIVRTSNNVYRGRLRLYPESGPPPNYTYSDLLYNPVITPGHFMLYHDFKDGGNSVTLSWDDLEVIPAGWTESGQAQALIITINNVHAQSQTLVKNIYYGLGQVQAQVKQIYSDNSGQAQARIKNTYRGHGQAKARIDTGLYTALDTFTRTVSNAMGTADVGGTWTYLTGAASQIDVNGSKLTFTASTADTVTFYLPRVSNQGTAQQVQAVWTPTSFGSESGNLWCVLYIDGPLAGSNNGTFVNFSVATSTGNVTLRLAKGSSNGTTVTIGIFPVGESWNIVLQQLRTGLTNSRVRAKAWRVGQEEPGWLAGHSNDTTDWGDFGRPAIRVTNGNATTTGTLDNFEKFDIGWTEYGQAQARIFAFDYPQHGQAQASILSIYTVTGQAEAEIDTGAVPVETTAHSQSLGLNGVDEEIYTAIDELVADDSDYIATSDLTGTYTARVKLGVVNPPTWPIDHIIRVRALSVNGTLEVRLYEANNLRASFQPTLTSVFETYEYSLSPAEIASIIDYTDLYLEFESTDRTLVSMAQLQVPSGQDLFVQTASGQAQASIKQTYNIHGQAQAWIEDTYEGHGQANAYILVVHIDTGQAQASILQTYNEHGQAQAQIKQTYEIHAQAQAQTKQVYAAHGQAQSWIEQTYVEHGQSQAQIKQTYFVVSQAQATIRGNAHAQAQAQIKQVYFVHAQAQASIEQTYSQVAQAQAQIKRTYEQHGQAQGQIKQIYVQHGQAQASIEQTYIINGQAEALIKDTYFGCGQAQSQIKQIYFSFAQAQATIRGNAFGQAQTSIKQSYFAHGQSAAIIKDTYEYTGQAEAWIEQTYNQHGQVQGTILQVYYTHGQAQADILQVYEVHGQAEAWIKNTYYAHGQAQATIINTYAVHAQAQTKLNAYDVTQTGQAQGNIKFDGNAETGQAQAKINAFDYPQHGQAQAWVETTYNSSGQAQANIIDTYEAHGQAEAWIKNTYEGLGQAQSQIKQSYVQHGQANAYIILSGQVAHGQAQANIRDTYNSHGQAQALVLRTEDAYGQAQGTVLQIYSEIGQAQADILATYNQHGQAQANIKDAYFGLGQAQAKINAYDVTQYGQAQANIQFQGNAVSGQAQAKINAYDVNQHGQSEAWIETTYNQHGQAQGQIKQTYAQYGQAEALITNTYTESGQAEGYIKALVSEVGQAQGTIKQIYSETGQAQADILQTYVVNGQASALISTAAYGTGQAQTTVITTYSETGQSQGAILQTYSESGNAQTLIRITVNAYAQAQGTIKSTEIGTGQAQATVISGLNGFGQAQAQILATYVANAQSEAVIIKSAGYGQARATIIVVFFFGTLAINDNLPVSLSLDDDLPDAEQADSTKIDLILSDANIDLILTDCNIDLILSDNNYEG